METNQTYTLNERDKAVVDLLWEYLKKDPEHKDRRQTAWGTKTQYGLARCIEAIYSEQRPDRRKARPWTS